MNAGETHMLCNSIFNHGMVKDRDGTYALSGDVDYEHIYECPFMTLKHKYNLPDPVYRKEAVMPPFIPFGRGKMWSRLKGLVPPHLSKIKNAMAALYAACVDAQMMVPESDNSVLVTEDVKWTVTNFGLEVRVSVPLSSVANLRPEQTHGFPRLHLLTRILDAAMIYIHHQNIRPMVYEGVDGPMIRYEPLVHYTDIIDALMHDPVEVHALLSHIMTEIVRSMDLLKTSPRLDYSTSLVLFGTASSSSIRRRDPRYLTVFFDTDYFFRIHDMILHRASYLIGEEGGGDVVHVPDNVDPIQRSQLEYLMTAIFIRMKLDHFLIPEKTKKTLQSLGWSFGCVGENNHETPVLKIEASLLDGSSSATLFDSVWDFAWKIHFDDKEMSGEEFKRYTKERSITANPAVKKVLRQIALPPNPSHQDLMRGFLQQSIEVRRGKEFLETLNRKTDFEVPSDLLKGTLKDYQLTGFRWVLSNMINCFGAVLADEMGLGKTVQAISVICYMLQKGYIGRVLVLSPAISVTNWEREFAKFAPSIRLFSMTPDADVGSDTETDTDTHQVLITSYEMYLHRKEIIGDGYGLLVLDEAQKIKNSATKTWSALQTFMGRYRLALTGTPLENNIMDIWSLFQTVLPGLLGTASEFKSMYSNLHESEVITRKLRKCIDPFILRRVKADLVDEVVIPNKKEELVMCELTPFQREMYSEYLAKSNAGSGVSKNMTSTFRIITHLKMICNHPASYEKKSPLDGVSGKWEFTQKAITSMLEEDPTAKMVIFTQFIEMGHLLVKLIRERCGVACGFLNGSDSAVARQRKIDDFQKVGGGNPVLVVSLRAGGCAINLTRATRVIIYDLWWNPAVISQAVDRAHRIGQTRELTVYKLVTQGTVEQKIYDTLVRKSGISDAIIQANEKWISRMTEDELRELLRLD